MFLLNLHLDLIVYASLGFAAGYVTCRIRTARRKRRP